MNFQTLQKIETANFYLDVAIRHGKKQAEKVREKTRGERLNKAAVIESERIKAVSSVIHGELSGILKNFPRIDEMKDFYRELVKCTIDYNTLKKSLGAVLWADKQATKLFRLHYGKIRNSRDIKTLYSHKKSYYGRVSSTIKQINEELLFLETSRKILKRFPTIKTDLPTIVIAGCPNVGKTTLLRAITGSEPKIASYPFTTQNLMLGYATRNEKKFQLIDTPGLLDRPLTERNKIELQSILALKHLAQGIIFVIDVTETCGYSIQEQMELLNEISKTFPINITVAVNKMDVADKEKANELKQMLKKFTATEISADKNIGIDKLVSEAMI